MGIVADVDEELERMAEQFQTSPQDLRQQIEDQGDGLGPIQAEISKRKALEWLVSEVKLIDEDGNSVEREDLELPDLTDSDSDEAEDGIFFERRWDAQPSDDDSYGDEDGDDDNGGSDDDDDDETVISVTSL